MRTATATIQEPQLITQGVCRYPIGLPLDRPTIRWYAEIVTPGTDIGPDGRRVDGGQSIILGDIEYTPGTTPGYVPKPDPGSRELAGWLAGGIAHPLGFQVGAVWYEGQGDREF